MSGGAGKIYQYAVAAVDRYGNEGAMSETAVDRPDSTAKRDMEEKRAEATDIGNVIREALDKIIEQIDKALDEAKVVKA